MPEIPVKFFKTLYVPSEPAEPNAVYFVKPDEESKVSVLVTDVDGYLSTVIDQEEVTTLITTLFAELETTTNEAVALKVDAEVVADALATKADGLPGVKVYRALLTQTGSDAPVATVLENTLGDTVVWSRASIGVYLGTLTGAFPANKTFVLMPHLSSLDFQTLALGAYCINDDQVEVRSITHPDRDTADSVLAGEGIQILVYP